MPRGGFGAKAGSGSKGRGKAKSGKVLTPAQAAAAAKYNEALHPRDAQGHFVTTTGGVRRIQEGTRQQRQHLAHRIRQARRAAKKRGTEARHSLADRVRKARADRRARQTFARTQHAAKATKAHKGGKPKAARSEMHAAQRVGTGKDARIVFADGTTAPAHIKPSMVAPAWTNVKVSRDPKADVLVTAMDAKGRPKTVYSDEFQAKTAATKFSRVSEMVTKHTAISKEIQAARGNPNTREEADCAWLMQTQATRPGSDRDTKAKVKAYGATTLRAEHVVESPQGVRLQFVGKEGIYHDHLIRDEKLGKMLLERKASAGERGGRLFATDDTKVRDFTSSLDGGKFTPKDFRTSAATRLATDLVGASPERSPNLKEHKKRVMEVATKVSKLLGNRPAQALESYIHPAVFSVWSPQ